MIKCPTYRRKSQLPQTGIAGLSSSFLLNNISEALHEIKDSQVTLCDTCDTCDRSHTIAYCKQCTSYCCKDCLEVHNRQDMNKEHELVRISKEVKHTNNTMQLGTSMDNKCTKHNAKVTLFCESCQELICPSCATHAHKKHEYELLADTSAFARYREGMVAMVPALHAQAKQLKKMEGILEEKQSQNNQ